jgi:porphobilinogen synthase
MTGKYPETRLRRLRQADWIREIVQETRLHPSDLILPLFVQEGKELATPIASLPEVSRLSIDLLVAQAKEALSLGIPAIALFPVTQAEKKTDDAKEALNPDNLVCRAVKELKSRVPEIGVICDVALDPYTSHGHDGLLINGEIANDETVEILAKQAVILAKAGADVVAPSDMMDGRIAAIRSALESENHKNTLILSYSAKYASSFYGPFRDAIGSTLNLKNASKATYQLNPANLNEALRKVEQDIEEGADMVMVKPGLPYLDVLFEVSRNFNVPVFSYQVSGEYAMIASTVVNGWVDGRKLLMETLISLKRAGASAIFTYGAVSAARELNK